MRINKFRLLVISIVKFNANKEIKINIGLCLRTTRQMDADHQWSVNQRLRTAALVIGDIKYHRIDDGDRLQGGA